MDFLHTSLSCENDLFRLTVFGQAERFWSYRLKSTGRTFVLSAPSFEVDQQILVAQLADLREAREPLKLANGCLEYRFTGTFTHLPTLALELIFRLAAHSPVLRFAYRLSSQEDSGHIIVNLRDVPPWQEHMPVHTLTKTSGHDELSYCRFSLADLPTCKEIHVSDFVELVHSFCLAELPVEPRYFQQGAAVMGPMLTASDGRHALLLAYEHGSQTPDAFVKFHLAPDRSVTLRAEKGNYYGGQPIPSAPGYQTLWLQLAMVEGSEDVLAAQYRAFVLSYQSMQAESRKPYIFYNTWNYQERNRWWNGKPYLDSMREERILAEIEVAQRMGIEVFVIDTGWYQKTGDWRVNTERFSENLKKVKERLDAYGMKLGLWFNPTAAAVSSQANQRYLSCHTSWHGREGSPQAVWETEESYSMCLVSAYSDHFADELIRLGKEIGVRYFKWDAIHQYGCDDPRHRHGTDVNSEQERADSYAFQLVREMTRIVERVCEALPDAIVDFDITEGQRAVGLSFLSAGKYFLINNGPYDWSYDLPTDEQKNGNLFFYPGQARGWICRTPLSYDKWIPSVLFLTHYLPDDPQRYQEISLASLILGQNGIWGDLLSVKEEGVQYIAEILRRYKLVRDEVTSSSPVRYGTIGGSPEIHEKIAASGRGVVVIFATAPGQYTYITSQSVVPQHWSSEGVALALDMASHAIIKASFTQAGAKIIFFGQTSPIL